MVVPSGSRPYFDGSQSDSFIELNFGYNGLGRLTGNETGSVVPGGEATAAGTSQGGMGGTQMGGSSAAGETAQWVAANFVAQTVGNSTIYDLQAS